MILGSTGLREDHSMANVLIASTYSDILQIELITSFYRIIFVRENTKINAHNERYLLFHCRQIIKLQQED